MAAYTPCTTGTVALYATDAEQLLAVPVEAWDETGAAHIAGLKGLILADTRPGFVRLEQASAQLPAPGRPVKEPVRIGPPPVARRERDDESDPRKPRPDRPGRQ
jgi:hypothetical protein